MGEMASRDRGRPARFFLKPVGWAKSPAAAAEYLQIRAAILPTLSMRDRTAWATAKKPLPTPRLRGGRLYNCVNFTGIRSNVQ